MASPGAFRRIGGLFPWAQSRADGSAVHLDSRRLRGGSAGTVLGSHGTGTSEACGSQRVAISVPSHTQTRRAGAPCCPPHRGQPRTAGQCRWATGHRVGNWHLDRVLQSHVHPRRNTPDALRETFSRSRGDTCTLLGQQATPVADAPSNGPSRSAFVVSCDRQHFCRARRPRRPLGARPPVRVSGFPGRDALDLRLGFENALLVLLYSRREYVCERARRCWYLSPRAGGCGMSRGRAGAIGAAASTNRRRRDVALGEGAPRPGSSAVGSRTSSDGGWPGPRAANSSPPPAQQLVRHAASLVHLGRGSLDVRAAAEHASIRPRGKRRT